MEAVGAMGVTEQGDMGAMGAAGALGAAGAMGATGAMGVTGGTAQHVASISAHFQ